MKKIRVAYFTSFREIVGDEKVSCIVVDPDTGQNLGYRRGNLEDITLMLSNPQEHPHPLARQFAETFDLAMVFSDDLPEILQASRESTHTWPLDARIPNGAGMIPLETLLVNVPSAPWRSIKEQPLVKIAAKAEYEAEIKRELQNRKVDLIISDSYLSLFGPTLLDEYGLRILNIHPAITAKHDPNRLPGVTPTRDAYTRAVFGYIIVDDKRDRDTTWPMGTPVRVEFEGKARDVIYVTRTNVTGVTVHVVTEEIDGGPVVRHLSHTFPHDTTREEIRKGNYDRKLELLPAAMLDYVRRPEIAGLVAKKRIDSQTRGS